MIPLNLITPGTFAAYLITGYWARAAYEEAALLGDARIAFDSHEADGSYRRIPRPSELAIDPQAAYVHLCSNNTLYGTQWHDMPETGGVPLIADMTSDILCRAVDVSRFGMIYAAAQKNLGPSGVTAVIIRKDLIDRSRQDIPTVWRYSTHAKAASLYYTPTTFAIAMMRHVLDHAVSIGYHAIEATNREKARRLYAALDAPPTTPPARRQGLEIAHDGVVLPADARGRGAVPLGGATPGMLGSRAIAPPAGSARRSITGSRSTTWMHSST